MTSRKKGGLIARVLSGPRCNGCRKNQRAAGSTYCGTCQRKAHNITRGRG